MSVQIHIVGENAAEALKELSVLAAPLTGGQSLAAIATTELPKQEKPARSSRSTTKQESASEKEEQQTKQEHAPEKEKGQPADTDPVDDAEDAGQPEESGEDGGYIPTPVELRAKATEVGTTPDAKKAVKALLEKYGCANISAVPDNHRVSFMKDLEALA